MLIDYQYKIRHNTISVDDFLDYIQKSINKKISTTEIEQMPEGKEEYQYTFGEYGEEDSETIGITKFNDYYQVSVIVEYDNILEIVKDCFGVSNSLDKRIKKLIKKIRISSK